MLSQNIKAMLLRLFLFGLTQSTKQRYFNARQATALNQIKHVLTPKRPSVVNEIVAKCLTLFTRYIAATFVSQQKTRRDFTPYSANFTDESYA